MMRWLGALALMLVAVPLDAREQVLVNPVLPSGPDPYVVTDGGWFYFMATRGDRLTIRRTRDLGQLAKAKEVVVWRPPATGPNAISIWAPELHRIDGKWFIYFTAAESGHDDDDHRGVFVLEHVGPDPMVGDWIDRGRVNTRLTGIDGTVFEARGRRWFVYSAYDGPDSVLALAPLANPWTLAAPEVVIARPDKPWERQGGRQILEGPAFLPGPKGGLFLAYSASACWSDDYALGLLRLMPNADPMDSAAWVKSPFPVLAKAPANNVYAPGHNAFFSAAGGKEQWIIYHANDGANVGCKATRSPRVAQMRWSAEGAPVFPVPIRAGTTAPAPRP